MVVAYIDGGSRGNPGLAGYGVCIEHPDGTLCDELYESVGVATNNVAEYRGLLAALRYFLSHEYRDAIIRSDSQLLVRQMRGEYRVRHSGLRWLSNAACELGDQLGQINFEHVPREMNVNADRLPNLAMDQAAAITD